MTILVSSSEKTRDTRCELNHVGLLPLYSNTCPCLVRVVSYTTRKRWFIGNGLNCVKDDSQEIDSFARKNGPRR